MKKLDQLVTNLADKCKESGASVLISIIDPQEKYGRVQVIGSGEMINMCLESLNDGIKETMEKTPCTCSGCNSLRERLGLPINDNHQHINFEDIFKENSSLEELLGRIFGGGSNDQNRN